MSIHLSFIHIDAKVSEMRNSHRLCRLEVGFLRGMEVLGGGVYSNVLWLLMGSTGCFVGEFMEIGLDLDCNQENSLLTDLLL